MTPTSATFSLKMVAPYRKVDIRDKTSSKSSPQALQLLKVNEGGKLAVDKTVLEFFHNEEVRDKKVCIVSVAGAMRQGKSFLLNFFLHFLNKKCQKGETKKNWISREGNLQTGFFWETRAEKVTEGILIWSEVFLTNIDNEEIAVILMDTQGTFDHELDLTQITCLFAMSVLLSSVQIFNIKNHITLNDLHHLQLFAGYAGFQQDNSRPFQKLLVLVRDWCYHYDQPFGEEGGNNLLQNIFAKHKKSNQNDIQETIVGNFEKVGAFLLPFPGEDVMQNRYFAGSFKDISTSFLDHVEELVSSHLNPEKLIKKQIGGKYISIGSLPTYVNSYLESFRSEKNPTIKTMFEATCDAQNTELVKELKRKYRTLMDKCGSFVEATTIKEMVLIQFPKRKMGNNANSHEMENQLKNDLEQIFSSSYEARINRKEFWRNLGSYFGIGSGVGGGIGSVVGGTFTAGRVTATTTLGGATVTGIVGRVVGGAVLGAVSGIFGGIVVVGGIALIFFLSNADNKGEATTRAEQENEQEEELEVPEIQQ